MRHHEFEDEPYIVVEKRSGGVGSFLLGIAVGAGVALLFAPRTGEETRRELGRRARTARTRVRDTVSDSFEQARARVEERIDVARNAYEIKKEQVTRAMEAGRAAAQEARDELERRIAETKAAYRAGADVARGGATRQVAETSAGAHDDDHDDGV